MSSIPGTLSKLTPAYPPNPTPDVQESETTQQIINALKLEKHIEGGYFAEIDRNPLVIPNPFLKDNGGDGEGERTAEKPMSGDDGVRNASTSIYYMLSPTTPQGHFHRNMGRTVRIFSHLPGLLKISRKYGCERGLTKGFGVGAYAYLRTGPICLNSC
jgi:predicted cupin superfamily sugar epimerase